MNKEAYLKTLVDDLKEKHPELKDSKITAVLKSDIPSEEEQVNQVANILELFEKGYKLTLTVDKGDETK